MKHRDPYFWGNLVHTNLNEPSKLFWAKIWCIYLENQSKRPWIRISSPTDLKSSSPLIADYTGCSAVVGQESGYWLPWTALQAIALNCTKLTGTTLNCTAVYCTALHHIILHCTAQHCIKLHCTLIPISVNSVGTHLILALTAVPIPTSNALHCTVLHCTALYCNVLQCSAPHFTALCNDGICQ